MRECYSQMDRDVLKRVVRPRMQKARRAIIAETPQLLRFYLQKMDRLREALYSQFNVDVTEQMPFTASHYAEKEFAFAWLPIAYSQHGDTLLGEGVAKKPRLDPTSVSQTMDEDQATERDLNLLRDSVLAMTEFLTQRTANHLWTAAWNATVQYLQRVVVPGPTTQVQTHKSASSPIIVPATIRFHKYVSMSDGQMHCIIKYKELESYEEYKDKLMQGGMDVLPQLTDAPPISFIRDYLAGREIEEVAVMRPRFIRTPHFAHVIDAFIGAAISWDDPVSRTKPGQWAFYVVEERAQDTIWSIESEFNGAVVNQEHQAAKRLFNTLQVLLFQVVHAIDVMAHQGFGHGDLHRRNVMRRKVVGTMYEGRDWLYHRACDGYTVYRIRAAIHQNDFAEIIDFNRSFFYPKRGLVSDDYYATLVPNDPAYIERACLRNMRHDLEVLFADFALDCASKKGTEKLESMERWIEQYSAKKDPRNWVETELFEDVIEKCDIRDLMKENQTFVLVASELDQIDDTDGAIKNAFASQRFVAMSNRLGSEIHEF